MKVTLDTPQMLVLESVPWIMGVLVSGLILVMVGIGTGMMLAGEWSGLALAVFGGGFGGLFFGAFVRRTRLVLDRAGGVAELKRRTVLGLTTQEWPLPAVTGAAVESSRDSDSGVTRRAVLRMADGTSQAIDPVYTSGGAPARAAKAINDWLAATGDAPAPRLDSAAGPD